MSTSDEKLAKREVKEISARVDARICASDAIVRLLGAVKAFSIAPSEHGDIHLGYRVNGNETLQYNDRFDTPSVTITPDIELGAPLWTIPDTTLVVSKTGDLLQLHLCRNCHSGSPCDADGYFTRLDWWAVGSDTGAYSPWEVCDKVDAMTAQIYRNVRRTKRR